MFDAQFFALAQRRQRIFGVFACGDSGAGRCAQILSLATRMSGHSQPGRPPGETVAYALAAGAGGSKFGSGRQGQDTLIANPLGAHHGRQDVDNDTYVIPFAQNTLIAGALQSHSKRHGHAMTTQQAVESNQIIAFESRYARNGRDAPDTIAPPLKAQSGGTGKGDAAPLVAGSGVRRLTPTECERLQGFPDGWTASQSDSARYRMLGNAVAVPVVEWIARRVAAG